MSEIGHQQAKRTAEYLKNEGIDHIAASTMRRAHETAMPLAELLGLEIELIDDLKESDHKSKTYVPAEEMDPETPAVAKLLEATFTRTFSVTDSIPLRNALLRGFDHVIDSNRSKTVVTFCHGMTTSVFLRSILKITRPTFDDCRLLQHHPSACGLGWYSFGSVHQRNASRAGSDRLVNR